MTEMRPVPSTQQRHQLIAADHQASQDYDRAILTLSTGALALSIAFIGNIAPEPDHTWAIFAAWSLLALASVLIVISYLTSQHALRKEIVRTVEAPEPCSSKMTGILNLIAGGLFVLGLGFLVLFASLNI